MRDFPGGPIAKTPNSQCRGSGSIPGQATRLHMPQLRVHMLQLKSCLLYLRLKVPHAPTKTQYSQIIKYFFLNMNLERTNKAVVVVKSLSHV